MDRISERARKARALGMSYGKYIAKFHPPTEKPVLPPRKKKTCILCGAKLTGKQIKYCLDCKDKADKLNKGLVDYREDLPAGGIHED